MLDQPVLCEVDTSTSFLQEDDPQSKSYWDFQLPLETLACVRSIQTPQSPSSSGASGASKASSSSSSTVSSKGASVSASSPISISVASSSASGSKGDQEKPKTTLPISLDDSDNAESYFPVDQILQTQVVEGQRQFLVRWMPGADGHEWADSWLPAYNLTPDLIQDFWTRQPVDERPQKRKRKQIQKAWGNSTARESDFSVACFKAWYKELETAFHKFAGEVDEHRRCHTKAPKIPDNVRVWALNFGHLVRYPPLLGCPQLVAFLGVHNGRKIRTVFSTNSSDEVLGTVCDTVRLAFLLYDSQVLHVPPVMHNLDFLVKTGLLLAYKAPVVQSKIKPFLQRYKNLAKLNAEVRLFSCHVVMFSWNVVLFDVGKDHIVCGAITKPTLRFRYSFCIESSHSS